MQFNDHLRIWTENPATDSAARMNAAGKLLVVLGPLLGQVVVQTGPKAHSYYTIDHRLISPSSPVVVRTENGGVGRY